MSEPVWLQRAVIDAMHDMLLAEHGGPSGLRDEGLLESALARPKNLYSYGEADLHALTASYAFGIVKNHPFMDGNKRTAFLSAYVFMRRNASRLSADEVAATEAVLALASSEMTEADFAAWLRENSQPS
ncbi:type II toxin-antitoxin system death-on-curing family toxin [Denitrobaculum tricleocarpae]|uniref:Type II toxin-antitoxin system death-on-curing family toxin n=1 Tax=Denitrobaculum tricleocarpae TaxID=2591009 RepID=A0A545U108_9PROT|nr:type II toxin-antitoxin system death-on-curing family toxin [Denitrobaculum tricleocarpae]TQV83093.1 type II toxin-antitoxin system death-on-curing family toxin [Denitrobaculum tricleocarpae]